MIDFFQQAPAWLWDHPWVLAASAVLCLGSLTASILLNPEGRTLREKLRRNR